MYEDISAALGDRYVMFYTQHWSARSLTPKCTLDQCILEVNDRLDNLGRNLNQWSIGDRDQIARLLRVNWIYINLDQEPIRKPILTHREHDQFVVDCGDTRLMALALCDQPQHVSLLVTDTSANAARYTGWTRVRNNQELLSVCGFQDHAHIFFKTAHIGQAIDWLEIGDVTTSHHLHDVNQCIRMMQAYLNQQDAHFLFHRAWTSLPICWQDYDTIVGIPTASDASDS